RRHTRSKRDWSSDVCSSDLGIATVWTLVIFKQEENKIKKYEEEDTVENEIKRSLEYESKSLKSNVPILTWIYTITIIVSLIVFEIGRASCREREWIARLDRV